ncbi:MAG: hypothetical protein LBQ66_02765 [Planctomycetaceae bacterium]|nr:hypothetical protein [Planctomycetaceae bacterium]
MRNSEFGIKDTAPNSAFRITHSELQTEAGGMPAFQSFAASRNFSSLADARFNFFAGVP